MKNLSIIFLFLFLPFALGSVVFDRIIATVDDEIILQSDLEKIEEVFKNQPPFNTYSQEERRHKILQKLIDEKIMLAIARRDTTIIITDKEVESSVSHHIARVTQQYGGEERLGLLLQQSEGVNLTQFKARMKEEYQQQLLKQKLQEKYIGKIEPSKKQIKQFYQDYRDSLPLMVDNYKISHIELPIKADQVLDSTARHLCDSLITLLGKGVSFVHLAKTFSDDPSGSDGGDLGFTKRGVLDADYEKAAFRLDVGAYTTKPVRSQYGYHIIKVTEKRDTEIKTSHILLMVRPTSSDTAHTIKFLDSLKQVAMSGGDFAQLARVHSDDQKTRENGGSLGWVTRELLSAEYTAVIDELEEGGISSPQWINNKFHLFRLDKKADERILSLEEDWQELSGLARNYIINKKLSDFVEKWRTQVYVDDRSSDGAANGAANGAAQGAE